MTSCCVGGTSVCQIHSISHKSMKGKIKPTFQTIKSLIVHFDGMSATKSIHSDKQIIDILANAALKTEVRKT